MTAKTPRRSIGPHVVISFLALAWGILACFCFFQSHSAKVFASKIREYESKKQSYLATVAKAIVVERYPASLQAAIFRHQLIWEQESASSLAKILKRLMFTRKYGEKQEHFLMLFNTPAIFIGTIFVVVGLLFLVRCRRYPGQKKASYLRQTILSIPLVSILAVIGALIEPRVFEFSANTWYHKVLVLLDTSGLVATYLATISASTFIFVGEQELITGGASGGETHLTWVQRRFALFAIGTSVAVSTLLCTVIAVRLNTYYALGRERLDAMRELNELKNVRISIDEGRPSASYLGEVTNLQSLLYSKQELSRTIVDMRDEVVALKLKALNSKYSSDIEAVVIQLQEIESAAGRVAFSVPYKNEIDGMLREARQRRQRGIVSLDEQQAVRAALQDMASASNSLAARLASDSRSFANLVQALQRIEDFGRTSDSILRNYGVSEATTWDTEALAREASKDGPPFTKHMNAAADFESRMRREVRARVLTVTDELLNRRELAQARKLLTNAAARLTIQLPDQFRALESLEREARIAANVRDICGTWTMAWSDSSLTKNYSATRQITIVPTNRPTTVLAEVSYSNTFKDGMFSKKKTIDRHWGAISVNIDVDGGLADLPDFSFSYSESARREIIRPSIKLCLRNNGSQLAVLNQNDQLLYQLSKQHQ